MSNQSVGISQDILDEHSDVTAMIEMRLGTAFSIVTILCIMNMYVVCETSFITNVLGDANMKFLATRALILISQIQLRALEMLVRDPDAVTGTSWLKDFFNLSVYRMRLLHSSLLTIECFGVVIYNLIAWNGDLKLEADNGYCSNVLMYYDDHDNAE